MSQRERWILYPLLFLAVALAGWDKVFVSGKSNFDEIVCKKIKAEEIYCAEMQTVSIDGTKKLLRLGATPEGGGELVLYHYQHQQPDLMLRAGASGGDLRTAAIECSQLIVTDNGQRALVEIGANPYGGMVNARSSDGAWGVALMHGKAVSPQGEEATVSGIFGIDIQAQQPVAEEDGSLWGMQFARPARIVPRPLAEPTAEDAAAGEDAAAEDATSAEPGTSENAAENDSEAAQGDVEESDADVIEADDSGAEGASGSEISPADLAPEAAANGVENVEEGEEEASR